MIKVYLDDVRPTPDGYIRTYTVPETIDFIKENDGNIEELSLDNDLGEGPEEGYMVMCWLEEEAYFGRVKPIVNIIVHSQNNVACDEMKTAIKNAKRYWGLQSNRI